MDTTYVNELENQLQEVALNFIAKGSSQGWQMRSLSTGDEYYYDDGESTNTIDPPTRVRISVCSKAKIDGSFISFRAKCENGTCEVSGISYDTEKPKYI